jgi:hypothetical protein
MLSRQSVCLLGERVELSKFPAGQLMLQKTSLAVAINPADVSFDDSP